MVGTERFLHLSSAFLGCLLLCQLIGNVPSASAEKSHCIWYGICSNTMVEKMKYCSYNGTALPIEDVSLMEQYCPELVAGGRACCNHEQLVIMSNALSVPKSILSNCPSCMKNFFKHICAMVCGPNQSDYLKPVKIGPFNATHDRVLEIDYHLGKTYKESTFNSCINVLAPPPRWGPPEDPNDPDIPRKALDMMCGHWGAENCTADRWFEFLGDETVPYVAFQINFVGDDSPVDGFTPYNPDTSRGCSVGENSVAGTSEEFQQTENSPPDNATRSVNPTALYWSSKLENLNPTQKLYAEKFINEILLEAKLGNLGRYSLRIYPSPRKLDLPSQPQSAGSPIYITAPFVSIDIEGQNSRG